VKILTFLTLIDASQTKQAAKEEHHNMISAYEGGTTEEGRQNETLAKLQWNQNSNTEKKLKGIEV